MRRVYPGDIAGNQREWAKFRCASSLIPSNVSIAEPLFHLNASMGRCVASVYNFLTFAPAEQPILPMP